MQECFAQIIQDEKSEDKKIKSILGKHLAVGKRPLTQYSDVFEQNGKKNANSPSL
jgi:hypothetical protein